jgi:uncharacterized protein YrrD
MRKGKRVIGQPVMSFADGKRLDSVKDLLISEANDSIVALLVDEGGLLSSSRVVPTENVRSFGRDAVVIESSESIVSASADPEVKAILERKDTLLGKRVVSDLGQSLGTISDVYFDEGTGRLGGFEVSGGMFGDIARGTSYLAVDQIERMGPDVVFVRPETGEGLENQVGGVQGALQGAGDKLSEATSKVGDATSRGVGGLQSGLAQREPEKALVGKRSGADITDENGAIIVANGQRIRPEHVEWAKETNNIGVLTRSATAGEAQFAASRAGDALGQVGDNVGSMWDRFLGRVGEMRDEQGRQADVQTTANRRSQIIDAIGRPVTKVILDRSDNVILDFGDIITHQSVQQAFDAGMLDTLLASVHRATVGFPLQDLKANQAGSATVERASGGAAVLEDLDRQVESAERERQQKTDAQRAEADRAREIRERDRQTRANERDAAERERTQELAEVQAGSGGSTDSGTA